MVLPLIALPALAAAFLLVGMHFAAPNWLKSVMFPLQGNTTAQRILSWPDRFLNRTVRRPFRHAASAISKFAGASLGTLTHVFSQGAIATRRHHAAQNAFTATTARGFADLRHVVVPRISKAAAAPALRAGRAAGRSAARARRRADDAGRRARRARKAAAAAAAAAAAIAAHTRKRDRSQDAAIGKAQRGVERLDKTTQRHGQALKQLAKLATLAGFASVMERAFVRRGWRFFRCSNFKKVGNRIGCSGFGLLNNILGDLIEVLVVTQVCWVAQEIELVGEQVGEPLLRELVTLSDFVCLGGGPGLPSATGDAGGAAPTWLPSAV